MTTSPNTHPVSHVIRQILHRGLIAARDRVALSSALFLNVPHEISHARSVSDLHGLEFYFKGSLDSQDDRHMSQRIPAFDATDLHVVAKRDGMAENLLKDSRQFRS